jgi:hypothetical protein
LYGGWIYLSWSWLSIVLHILKTSFISTFSIAFSGRCEFPTENIFILGTNDRSVFYFVGQRFKEKSIDKMIVPRAFVWDPKIINLGIIREISRLNDETIVDIRPTITPRSAPYRYVSLSNLIEAMYFENEQHFRIEAQKADLGILEFGRQMEECGKYLDLRIACKKSLGWSTILQDAIRIRP